MKSKKSILTNAALVTGTSIGGGILALPIMVGNAGFMPGCLVCFAVWFMMLLAAWIMSEEYLATGSHELGSLTQMYGRILGKTGKHTAELAYTFLYVALLLAYTTGINGLCERIIDVSWKQWLTKISSLGLLSLLLLRGSRSLQRYNAILTSGLVVSCLLLVLPCYSHIRIDHLLHLDWTFTLTLFPIFLCSYGFHVIIPTLCQNLEGHKSSIRKAIFIGSLVTLLIYLLFLLGTLGSLPLRGASHSLEVAHQQGLPVTVPLGELLGHKVLILGFVISLLAMATSFLGVSESFSQFLKDNGRVPSLFYGRCIALAIPLLAFLQCEKLFLTALNWAGIFCGILFGVLPSLSWAKRLSCKRTRIAGVALAIAFGCILYMDRAI